MSDERAVTADLIERLTKATGPDRELDADIALAVGEFSEKHGLPGGGWVSKGPHHAIVGAPSYTASLDAARTLVKDFYWLVSEGKTRDAEPLGGAQVFRRDYLVKPVAEAEHELVEIALCIAALKARSAL